MILWYWTSQCKNTMNTFANRRLTYFISLFLTAKAFPHMLALVYIHLSHLFDLLDLSSLTLILPLNNGKVLESLSFAGDDSVVLHGQANEKCN